MNKLNIFILAAGLGERLRPITDHIPKPLMPVLGKPVIQYVLDTVSTLPFHKIGVNFHYKRGLIEEWLKACQHNKRITTFYESKILGTGGALKNAEEFLKDRDFLVHNSDILSDIDLQKLIEHHFSSGNLATLVVHDCPEFNCLKINDKGQFEGIIKNVQQYESNEGLLAFTGIALYQSEVLKFLPEGASSVVDAWFQALDAGHTIGTYNASGAKWSDIGAPAAYASAVFDKLKSEGEVIFIHPSVKGCDDVDLQGHVVIEKGCELHKGVLLKDCIVLPGGVLPPDRGVFENCIIGRDFVMDLNKPEISDLKKDGRQLIGTGGSDRQYYRVRQDNRNVVLMQCTKEDPDFERQIEYTRFFLKHGIPVPELLQTDTEKMQAVFEDAGDISLYSYLKCPRENMAIADIYKKVLDALVMLHTSAGRNISECLLLQKRIFDYEYFRWETDYFIERYVVGIRNANIKDTTGLEKELHALALKADSFPKTVIHRDFQSQNVMVMKGQRLRLIDYQGARIGPPAYDVASIVWDPYFRIADDVRVDLLDYYVDRMKSAGLIVFDEQSFRSSLTYCRLQRHMQALGAYGFLSAVKSKKYFMKYIPEGLRLLKEDILPAKDEFPEMYTLIMKL